MLPLINQFLQFQDYVFAVFFVVQKRSHDAPDKGTGIFGHLQIGLYLLFDHFIFPFCSTEDSYISLGMWNDRTDLHVLFVYKPF